VTEIFYLSGTGNSLHVAHELIKRIPDATLIPLAGLKNEKEPKTKGDIAGFIFPVHFMTAPSIVFEILEKIDMQSVKYVFVIATRYGTPCNVMYKQIEKILKQKNKRLDSHLTINMANNDPKFKVRTKLTQEEFDSIEIMLQKKVDLIHNHILKQEGYHEIDTEVTFKVNPIMERLGVFAISLIGDGKEDFYSNANCDGCGSCEKVCPASKIKMLAGKPQWLKKEDCFSCYACINYCPRRAIQIKPTLGMKYYTEQNDRYHHPEISIEEIVKQKYISS
jgi:ferredoxin